MTRLDIVETPGPRVLHRLVVGGASLVAAGVTAALLAVPALANGSETHPTPPPCGTGNTVPTANCTPSISGNQVLLPGIGTINLTLATNNGKTTITAATFTAASGNTTITCVAKIDGDNDKVRVTCTDNTNATVAKVTIKVDTTTGALKAKLRVPEKDEDKDEHESKSKEGDSDGKNSATPMSWTQHQD